VSRLEAAKGWYDQQVARLSAIDSWVHAGRKSPEEGALRRLVDECVRLSKADAFGKLKAERGDVQRVALIRLFAGFEADFRLTFAAFLVRPHRGLDVEDVRSALPPSMEHVAFLAQSLEPRFAKSDKNWLDGFRGFRNELMHYGFAEKEVPPKYEPTQAHAKLRAILASFEPPRPALDQGVLGRAQRSSKEPAQTGSPGVMMN
jgi:hypothetical protein